MGARAQPSAVGMQRSTWERLDVVHAGAQLPKFEKRMIGRGFRTCFGPGRNTMAMKCGTNMAVVRNNSVDFVASTTEHRVCGKRRTCEES